MIIKKGERAMIPTGLFFSIPEGYEIQVRPRSGLAAKNGVTVLNTPGTIDSDYRGEVKVILVNLGNEDFEVKNGERIAQIVVAPVTIGSFEQVTALDETERGAGGFGSTGK
jgi:dUTP pyrophosphatase